MVISCLIFKLGIIKESYDLLRSSLLYGFVFIETISYYSEVETNKRIIYAVLVGILTYIFNKLINIYEGVFVAILISNVIMYFINKKKV